MNKHKTKAILSQMRFERRQKIEVIRQRVRDLDQKPLFTSEQIAEVSRGRAFLLAEIAKLQRELDDLARGSKAQILAGWGH